MAKESTSITSDRMKSHLTDDKFPLRSELSCEKIHGFFLMKGKTGGTWYFRYWDASGKKQIHKIGNIKPANLSRAGDDPRNLARLEAVSRALQIRGGIESGIYPHTVKEEKKQQARRRDEELKQSAESTLGKYLEGPFAAAQKRKKDEGRGTMNILRSNFGSLLDRPLDSIKKADIKEWQNRREEQGRAYSTIKRAFGALRTLMNSAVADGVILAPPFEAKSLQKQRAENKAQEIARHEEEGPKKRRMLTEEEIDALWKGLAMYDKDRRLKRENSIKHGKGYLPTFEGVRFVDWFEPALLLAYYTGMRPGDLYALRWPNIRFADVGSSRLRFLPEKTQHHDDPTKVDIKLHPDAEEALRAWWEQCGKPDSGYVLTEKPEQRLGRQAHDTKWKKVKTFGGIPDELDFYCFRHNFISAAINKNHPLKHIAEAVGHKSTAMIEQNYAHVLPERKDEMVMAMGSRKKEANG
jgi:integrase